MTAKRARQASWVERHHQVYCTRPVDGIKETRADHDDVRCVTGRERAARIMETENGTRNVERGMWKREMESWRQRATRKYEAGPPLIHFAWSALRRDATGLV